MNEYIITFETEAGVMTAKKVLAYSLVEAIKKCPGELVSAILIARARTKIVA